MHATLIYGAGDARVENAPDPVIKQPTDALVRITTACICGSDLHPYHSMSPADGPARIGHEFIGVVEDTGAEVTSVGRATWCSHRSRGKVVDHIVDLDGYRAMDSRDALKVLVKP